MHVLLGKFLELERTQQDPLRLFSRAHFRTAGAVKNLQKKRIRSQAERQRSELRAPVAVSFVRTESETGSGFAVPVDLFGEPLKPFPIFL